MQTITISRANSNTAFPFIPTVPEEAGSSGPPERFFKYEVKKHTNNSRDSTQIHPAIGLTKKACTSHLRKVSTEGRQDKEKRNRDS